MTCSLARACAGAGKEGSEAVMPCAGSYAKGSAVVPSFVGRGVGKPGSPVGHEEDGTIGASVRNGVT